MLYTIANIDIWPQAHCRKGNIAIYANSVCCLCGDASFQRIPLANYSRGHSFSGPEDLDEGSWTQIGTHSTCTYIIHVSLKSFDWNTDFSGGTVWTTELTVEFLCTVDGTFVLAAFVPFHSVDLSRFSFIASKAIDMHRCLQKYD